MKTSKIIFISLLGTILFVILAAVIDIRINGKRNDNLTHHKHDIPSFKVLSLRNCKYIGLHQGNSDYIQVIYDKDSIVPKVNFAIKGDTLILSDVKKLTGKGSMITICTKSSPNKIELKNSVIDINNFVMEVLSLELERSSASLYQVQDENSILNISAKDGSSIKVKSSKIKEVNVKCQSSAADLQIVANKISGNISEKSSMVLKPALEMYIERDSTSTIAAH